MPVQHPGQPLSLTTREAAAILDVHESSVKRWCNDGELPAERTRGGHRRLRLGDVLDFARQRGIDAPLLHFAPDERRVYVALHEAGADGGLHDVGRLAFDWLGAYRTEQIEALFRYAWHQAQLPLPAIFDRIMVPLLQQIGLHWQTGVIGVAHEHFCTQVVLDALYRLRGSILQGRQQASEVPRAIAACAEGECHEIGIFAVRLLLEAAGWEVDYLGADVPITELAVQQRLRPASLICVSFVPPRAPADAQQTIRVLSQLYEPSRPFALALGGAALGAGFTIPPGPHPFTALEVFHDTTSFAAWLPGLATA